MDIQADITFVIWDNGDPSVGIQGQESSVTTWVVDSEHLEALRQDFQDFFSDIHDAPVTVMTSQELEEANRAEEEEEGRLDALEALEDF